MSSSLKVVEQTQSVDTKAKKDNVIAINSKTNGLLQRLSSSSVGLALSDFKHEANNKDSKLLDYLVIGVLSLAVHTLVVGYFKDSSAEGEIVKPPKKESKVQITFVKPQPPKPIIQPPPPKVVALKKPPKPKTPPKPEPVYEPVPTPGPVTENIAPKPAPPAPVEEKITLPSQGGEYLNNPAPGYPDIAIDRGWEGTVQLKVRVLANGKPDKIIVVKSSGHTVLDDEAIRTVTNWSFEPAKRGSTPIDYWYTFPVSFKL